MEETISSAVISEVNRELRPLERRDVLWAVSIILGLTVAPSVADIYAAYLM